MALDTGGAPLAVTTACSSCGGRLEFEEGTNAVRCGHCGSRHLVTRRRRVVSYVVHHEVDAARAVAAAGAVAEVSDRHAEPELWYVPYYRFTATELRFEREVERPSRGGPMDPRWIAAWPLAFAFAGGDAAELFRSPRTMREEWRSSADALRFIGRRVERSLRACAADVAPSSLGLRTPLLRASLLRAGALPPRARVVACDLPAASAFRAALGPARDDELLCRQVVERVLSLLYHPIWLVPVRPPRSALVVVDGFSSNLLGEVAREAIDALAGAPPDEDDALALRPHACPNCGNDLPVEARDVVFHCGSCERAWLLDGDRFDPVSFAVAAPPRSIDERELRHYPFWEVPRAGGGERVWVPAFRQGSAKRLKDFAVTMSRCAGRFTLDGHGRRALSGCALDAADAAAVATFLAGGDEADGMRSPRRPESAPAAFGASAARLVWLPFVRDAYGWREPVTGQALLPERPLGT